LTINSKIVCPHGGQVLLLTSNTRVFVGNVPALMESEIHPVIGCAFTVGSKYSPCVKVGWTQGSVKTKVNGVSLLVKNSIGKCTNLEGAPQGTAIIINTQLKADAQ
jgi:hypothetical protein